MNIDAGEIASILAKELWFQQLASLDGLNSGVPTRTTATLTPTTLRSIEQTFIELQCQAETHSSQAGFVPPALAPGALGGGGGGSHGGGGGGAPQVGFTGGALCSPGPSSASSLDSGEGDSRSRSPSPAPSPSRAPPRRRGMGGRRPAHAQPRLSPEEEERRNVRRERNKMAAARCRKRRLDRTNDLVEETEGLERKKQSLQAEIQQLQQDREELEFILETHRACCRLQSGRRTGSPPDVKPAFQALLAAEPRPCLPQDVRIKLEPDSADVFTSPQTNNKRVMLSSANPQVLSPPLATPPATKPSRPNFLNVPLSLTPAQAHGLKSGSSAGSEVAGVPITTPSTGIPFNFDSLMDGGTGLTPVQPMQPVQPCSTQQHKTQPEMGSPDAQNSSKLVSL